MDISSLNRGQITLMGASVCVMLTMHFTVQLLSQHLFYWKNPKEQKAIVIIILMAPIYAIDSFVGLVDVRGSKPFFTFLESIKECYEALVSSMHWVMMLNFFIFLFLLIGLVPDSHICTCRWLQNFWHWCIVIWIYLLVKILCLMKSKEEKCTIHFQWLYSR